MPIHLDPIDALLIRGGLDLALDETRRVRRRAPPGSPAAIEAVAIGQRIRDLLARLPDPG